MARDLVLEIGVEEMPSLAVEQALDQLESKGRNALDEARLPFESIHVLATPRRLVVHVSGLQEGQKPVTHEVKGPPRAAAFNEAGEAQPAALGFAKSQGVEPEELVVREAAGGEYVFAVKEEAGRPAAELLPAILPGLVGSLTFPKSMRWRDGDFRFVRPIRWFLALFGPDVVEFEIAGLRAGRTSYGHRLLAPCAFEASEPADYFVKLAEAKVVLDQNERAGLIRDEAQQVAATVGGTARTFDEVTFREVVELVEYPSAILGRFSEEHADLPAPVLIAAMESHQRYFPVEDGSGNLLPAFVVIQNGDPAEAETIRRGHERVLRARLADAAFFFAEDKKKPLGEYVPRLEGVVFQEKLGTYLDKQQRLVTLVRSVLQETGETDETRDAAVRAAELCKADLVTEMVVEFPTLQGTMGEVYAGESGESEETARAIGEQYRPRFSGDLLPQTPAGTALSISDKLDTIAGCFGIGLIPTSSQDPYGLRRQALGIITMIVQEHLPVRIVDLAGEALAAYGEVLAGTDLEETRRLLADFFAGRAKNHLLAEEFDYDIVDAVLTKGLNELDQARPRLEALTGVRREGRLEPLLLPYNRCKNLSKGVEGEAVDKSLLVEPAEKELLAAVEEVQPKVEVAIARHDYAGALAEFQGLRAPVDKFFDDVLVMVDDTPLRENRLHLLNRCAHLFEQVADLSKIVQGMTHAVDAAVVDKRDGEETQG